MEINPASRRKQPNPPPLIQYLAHQMEGSDAASYPGQGRSNGGGRCINVKFAINPAAMVEAVELEVLNRRIQCPSWKYQLVSVSSPGYADFPIPGNMGPGEYKARITAQVKKRPWSSGEFVINIP